MELDFEDSFLNGNVLLSYNYDCDIMLYVFYGVGSKIGGFVEFVEVISGDFLLDVFEGGVWVKLEEVYMYEVGVKLVLLD